MLKKFIISCICSLALVNASAIYAHHHHHDHYHHDHHHDDYHYHYYHHHHHHDDSWVAPTVASVAVVGAVAMAASSGPHYTVENVIAPPPAPPQYTIPVSARTCRTKLKNIIYYGRYQPGSLCYVNLNGQIVGVNGYVAM